MDSIIARGAFMQGLLENHMHDFRYEHFEKDILTLRSRYSSEGLSFFTKTLPLLGQAVLSALCSGRFICPPNFRCHRGSVLPVFLYGAISKVFFDDGRIKDPAPSHIFQIRQITMVFYKTSSDLDDSMVTDALNSFIQRDVSLRPVPDNALLAHARDVVSELFSDFSVTEKPRFGPGATSDMRSVKDRWESQYFYSALDQVYPYDWFFPYTQHRGYSWYGENRVLFVPKDSRGPRTISCEPPEYMYYQQAVGRSMMEHLSRFPFINFTDQTVNQEYARRGSLGEGFNTLDFKDASDMISLELVSKLFSKTPLVPLLSKLRTPVSLLPDGSRLFLKKFAAMGSALCFPVESVVFYAILKGYSRTFGGKSFFSVYGDDVVTDRDDLDSITERLSEFNLVVNTKKSFFAGPFRESCGGDYVNGVAVNYIKCTSLEPSSIISFANRLYESGMERSALFVSRHVRAPFGRKAIDCYHFGPPSGRTRISRYGNLEVYTRTDVQRYATLGDQAAYFRWLSGGVSEDQTSFRVGLRNQPRKMKFVQVFS